MVKKINLCSNGVLKMPIQAVLCSNRPISHPSKATTSRPRTLPGQPVATSYPPLLGAMPSSVAKAVDGIDDSDGSSSGRDDLVGWRRGDRRAPPLALLEPLPPRRPKTATRQMCPRLLSFRGTLPSLRTRRMSPRMRPRALHPSRMQRKNLVAPGGLRLPPPPYDHGERKKQHI